MSTSHHPRIRVGADEVVVRASSAETGGALFAIEVHMAPGGGPPFMHRHPHGELFHVLDGELTFHLEDDDGTVRRRTASAGTVIPIPGGQPHTVRNESEAGATALAIHAPGEAMERFAHAAAALARDGRTDPHAVAELAARHGIEATGPLPAAAPS